MPLPNPFDRPASAGMNAEYLLAHKIHLEQDLHDVERIEQEYGKNSKATIKSLLMIVESRLAHANEDDSSFPHMQEP